MAAKLRDAVATARLDSRDARLSRARRYIERRFDGPVAVSQAAAVAGMSTSQFIRVFRAAHFQTPHQYITRLRIERARELLLAGESVTDVCLSVGFESLGSFSTLFRRYQGESPTEFRERRHRTRRRGIPGCFLAMYAGAP